MDYNINSPIPAEWESYVSQLPSGLEVIPAVLYSQKDYVSAQTTRLTLFDFTNPSREDLTNMQLPSQLPNPEAFLIQNIRVFFKTQPESDDSGTGDTTPFLSLLDDLVNLTNNGVFKLKISNKLLNPWPMWMLPANSFIKGMLASGSDLGLNYGQLDGFLYAPMPNVMIGPQQTFFVSLEWPGGAITLTQNDAANLPIQVLFDGQQSRSIQ